MEAGGEGGGAHFDLRANVLVHLYVLGPGEGPTAIEDNELVRRILAGDEDAFTELVRRFERPVLRLVLRIVRDRSKAEDVAQEAFLKAHRALGSYQHDRRFSSWLFKIAHNTAIDHLRKRQLDTVSLSPSSPDEPDLAAVLADPNAISPVDRAEASGAAAALGRVIGAMREEWREVVLLRFGEGLSYQEIADILELPIGTVKTYIHRARREIVQGLAAEGYER